MNSDQDDSFDKEELTEFNQDAVQNEEDACVSIQSQSVKSRGRPRIPE